MSASQTSTPKITRSRKTSRPSPEALKAGDESPKTSPRCTARPLKRRNSTRRRPACSPPRPRPPRPPRAIQRPLPPPEASPRPPQRKPLPPPPTCPRCLPPPAHLDPKIIKAANLPPQKPKKIVENAPDRVNTGGRWNKIEDNKLRAAVQSSGPGTGRRSAWWHLTARGRTFSVCTGGKRCCDPVSSKVPGQRKRTKLYSISSQSTALATSSGRSSQQSFPEGWASRPVSVGTTISIQR